MSLDPEEQQSEGPVIRDKRRIDPETGQVRERPATAAPDPGNAARSGPEASTSPQGTSPQAATAEATSAEAELAERTADLKRLQAEYLNYKRRVDRERENTRATAVASTLAALLPVLDDIARAREHEELTGGFKAVAESLERTVSQLGMTSFGEVGDPFDPRIHDALMHSYSDDVDGPVCQAIVQVGYRIGERIVRPARVAVAEPPSTPTEPVGAPEPAGDEWFAEGRAEAGTDQASNGTSYDDNGDAQSAKDDGAGEPA